MCLEQAKRMVVPEEPPKSKTEKALEETLARVKDLERQLEEAKQVPEGDQKKKCVAKQVDDAKGKQNQSKKTTEGSDGGSDDSEKSDTEDDDDEDEVITTPDGKAVPLIYTFLDAHFQSRLIDSLVLERCNRHVLQL